MALAPGPDMSPMPPPRKALLRDRLERELRAVLQRAGATDGTIASVMEAGCRLDGVGAAGVSAELESASRRLNHRARELAGALDRLDRGECGRCATCGEPIDTERLDLLPTATRCRGCSGA